MAAQSILLHICCGPCAIMPVQRLREKGMDVVGLFYNPNIHGVAEYLRRREALVIAADRMKLRVFYLDAEYDPKLFMRTVVNREDERCGPCCRLRLGRTFAVAQSKGFQTVSTTLLYSRHQNHEAILALGRKAREETGVHFHGQDFRSDWQEGIDLSREWGLFRQNYCGCLYSEMERQAKVLRRLAASEGPSSPAQG